ncbi:MAG: hypothetical protein J6B45_04895 [Clostridia bacterium]|nr:hypothetical protein [Clostridia bacterium]
MKKLFILALSLLLFASLLVSCSDNETVEDNGSKESLKTDSSTEQPDKKDEIPEGEYALTVEEEHKGLLYEPLKKSYKAGEKVIVKTHILMDASVVVKLNGESVGPQKSVKDENGRFIYNEQEFIMPPQNSVLSLTVGGGMLAPPTYNLTFEPEKDCVRLFEDTFSGEYTAGETIKISSSVDILDAEILLKLNGVKIEETDYGEWQFVMPSEDATVKAYLIGTSWGDDWHYLNIEDRDGILRTIADNYYREGERVTLYSNVLLYLDADCEINVLDYLYMESEGIYEYKFIMPRNDVTLKISEYKEK